ncbi:AAA family ATPase [Teichococcus cervicalis]|uniref:AAA+ ATPase domain-containing protein n=1 Tax=Pseudoroseomonas cervicalis ATCC 49957 TaxID=525371 RepID=D5RQ72_9PROT|nr:AAA family ATPase [Pseudoroseomonas cervicalis]EFH10530.1 hypothetical protein HMPREF0731_3234 [Pseudoroseomonas cervicalis ATCC 49957]
MDTHGIASGSVPPYVASVTDTARLRSVNYSEIARFVDALFRYATPGGCVSLRAFREGANGVFDVSAHRIGVDKLGELAGAAVSLATRAANAPFPVVFCPPVATFTNSEKADEASLLNGLALSVECDAMPLQARVKLESLIGPATVVVASGGEWADPQTGEVQPKLHLHWRLNEPTFEHDEHAVLKRARALAAALVGGDASNKPIVHPIRWPGTWHRKGEPRLSRIVAFNPSAEIDLQEAMEWLEQAFKATGAAEVRRTAGALPAGDLGAGEERETEELIPAILSAQDYHAPLVALAMRYLKGGMADAQVVLTLRGIMNSVPPDIREVKGGIFQAGRWQSRYDDIPRAVSTAREKLDERTEAGADTANAWADTESFRLDLMTQGEPPPRRFLLEPLMPLGTVGLLFGEGGLGKSMVALDLALLTARATRGCGLAERLLGPLGGTMTQHAAGASVFITLEDDKAELHRRANALDPHRERDGAPCFVIPALDLPGFDPALVTTDRGRVAVLTSFAAAGLDTLLSNIARSGGHPVRLLILDPAGDFLEGDENDATHVKRLMRLLREKASAHGCTILLLGHVAKGASGASMRGSGAWVANSRFAYSLRRPDPQREKTLIGQLRRAGVKEASIVIGQLVKANHAGAPTHRDRVFVRCAETGRLIDESRRITPPEPDAALIEALVAACADYAAAGIPFKLTGAAGLYAGQADLPEPLSTLSKNKLELLGKQAVEARHLVKCKGPNSRTPDCLDVPGGPYAKGPPVVTNAGSRREALAQYRRRGHAQPAAIIPEDLGNYRKRDIPDDSRERKKRQKTKGK